MLIWKSKNQSCKFRRTFEGHTNLVTSSVEVCSIDQGGEGDNDPVPQLLLVAQAHLAAVVHLGPDHGPVLQDVLGADPELGGGPCGAPAQGDPGLQGGGELLIH